MKQLIKRVVDWLISAILGVVFVIGGLILLAEWLSGCGEHYIDAQGRTVLNQCLFIQQRSETRT